MTRGPAPEDTFREAAEIAGRRGTIKWFDRLDRATCNFAVFATDLVALVKIRRIHRIHCCPEEILRDFADTIAQLKGAVYTRGVVFELWLCSYHRTWRFFRILGSGLAELDRDGKPVGGAPLYGGP